MKCTRPLIIASVNIIVSSLAFLLSVLSISVHSWVSYGPFSPSNQYGLADLRGLPELPAGVRPKPLVETVWFGLWKTCSSLSKECMAIESKFLVVIPCSLQLSRCCLVIGALHIVAGIALLVVNLRQSAWSKTASKIAIQFVVIFFFLSGLLILIGTILYGIFRRVDLQTLVDLIPYSEPEDKKARFSDDLGTGLSYTSAFLAFVATAVAIYQLLNPAERGEE